MSLSDKENELIKRLRDNTTYPIKTIEDAYEHYKGYQGQHLNESACIANFYGHIMSLNNLGMKEIPNDPITYNKSYDLYVNDVISKQNILNEQQRQLQLINANAYNSAAIESFKAVIGFADASIKALILANGGALIAFFTFCQTVAKDKFLVVQSLLSSSIFFIYGLITAIAIPMLSYVFQAILNEKNPQKGFWKSTMIISRFAAVICAVASLILFALGGNALYKHMENLPSNIFTENKVTTSQTPHPKTPATSP